MNSPMPIIERINYSYFHFTKEKQKTDTGYILQLLRKTPKTIAIVVDHINETLTINGVFFKTRKNYEYTYRECRGNIIEVSDFCRFIVFLKQASERESIWHTTFTQFLLKIAK